MQIAYTVRLNDNFERNRFTIIELKSEIVTYANPPFRKTFLCLTKSITSVKSTLFLLMVNKIKFNKKIEV